MNRNVALNSEMRGEFTGVNALLIGSIGSLTETSEIQLEAYNRAFREVGLDWHWLIEEYEGMLIKAGGELRLRKYAQKRGLELSDETILAAYEKKCTIFCDLLQERQIRVRPGLADLLVACKSNGVSLGWVTTTLDRNINAIRKALHQQFDFNLFDIITTIDDCDVAKPEPEIYHKAISMLNVTATGAVAIEDSSSGVAAAKAATIQCIAAPGDLKGSQDFSAANICVSDLSCVTAIGEQAGAVTLSIN